MPVITNVQKCKVTLPPPLAININVTSRDCKYLSLIFIGDLKVSFIAVEN